MLGSVRQLKLNRSWVMQQDNDPKHRSKSTTEWLQQKKICLLERLSQSPELNPIEIKPKNIAELKQFCKEEWSKIIAAKVESTKGPTVQYNSVFIKPEGMFTYRCQFE
ncbi:unnamed protein product [Oncorhynchus mykiss]|uniref:Tc1-like transposase DDE domain-containing protein n=1 Tax=Oncorhynchus mykiss TaxID=8022 RepID=A0A060Y987_ONCMY|nr:unnamed protein product [Oncorhynchus mykiss]